jgi:hypothetical protein
MAKKRRARAAGKSGTRAKAPPEETQGPRGGARGAGMRIERWSESAVMWRVVPPNPYLQALLSRAWTFLAALASSEMVFGEVLALPIKLMSTTQCPVVT